ncbi:MAG: hypothetical protein U5J96_15815 [Ignavibacteriaceae bacterium]|nr:hypothetical protein [Ignavibacteriaceae bacterium]
MSEDLLPTIGKLKPDILLIELIFANQNNVATCKARSGYSLRRFR